MCRNSKFELSRGVVELVVVQEETKRLLKLVHALVALLGFVSRNRVDLGFLCLFLLYLLLGGWTLSLLLYVGLGVPVDVKAVGAILLEEELLKVGLKLVLGDGLEHGNQKVLAIELVLVGGELLGPEAVKIFA